MTVGRVRTDWTVLNMIRQQACCGASSGDVLYKLFTENQVLLTLAYNLYGEGDHTLGWQSV
jgi:hypothetical protein